MKFDNINSVENVSLVCFVINNIIIMILVKVKCLTNEQCCLLNENEIFISRYRYS